MSGTELDRRYTLPQVARVIEDSIIEITGAKPNLPVTLPHLQDRLHTYTTIAGGSEETARQILLADYLSRKLAEAKKLAMAESGEYWNPKQKGHGFRRYDYPHLTAILDEFLEMSKRDSQEGVNLRAVPITKEILYAAETKLF